jgi:hypothetical protein
VDNEGARGSAIYNYSEGDGAGNYPAVINCVFFNNTANDRACVYNNRGTLEVVNCTLFGNQNSILDEDAAAVFGSADERSDFTLIVNSIIRGNIPGENQAHAGYLTMNYSAFEGDVSGITGTGNIDTDPKLADPNAGNFVLLAGSPCIDAADSNDAITSDIDGNLRYDDPASPNTGVGPYSFYDMGAYEYQGP